METPLNDAKPELESSATQDAAAASSAAQDVNADPSTATGEQTDAQRDAEILKKVEESQGDGSAPPADEAGKAAKEVVAKEEPDKTKVAAKTPEQQKAEDDKLPFNKHPRWQEMQRERETLRAENESLKKAATTWEENKAWLQEKGIAETEYPQILEAYAQSRQSGVTHQDYVETMKWRALINTDPTAALKYAEDWLGQVKVYAGQVLPKDLQDAVTAGEISEAWAKKVAEGRLTEARAKGTLQSHEQLTQKTQEQLIAQSTNDWLEGKLVNDPDLKASLPKTGEVARTGKFAMLMKEFSFEAQQAMTQKRRALTPQENTAVLEEAYKAVCEQIASFTPRAPARKAPLRNGSSAIPELGANPTEEQLDERILAEVGSRHGAGF